jgi:hypothetical protein
MHVYPFDYGHVEQKVWVYMSEGLLQYGSEQQSTNKHFIPTTKTSIFSKVKTEPRLGRKYQQQWQTDVSLICF